MTDDIKRAQARKAVETWAAIGVALGADGDEILRSDAVEVDLDVERAYIRFTNAGPDSDADLSVRFRCRDGTILQADTLLPLISLCVDTGKPRTKKRPRSLRSVK
jgi:hypothetical protein